MTMSKFVIFVVLAAICAIVSARSRQYTPKVIVDDVHQAAFENWRGTYKKSYPTYEIYANRMAVFKKNSEFVEEHNAKNLDWKLKLNRFADMTWDEFKSRYGLGKKIPLKTARMQMDLSEDLNVPDSWDWTTKGGVTEVKDQGQCGSCWSFSTTGATEGAYFVKHGKLISLSEQQLIDCSGPEGEEGCNGGLMDFAFQYIIDNKGICTEDSYPNEFREDTCREKECVEAVQVESYVDVATNNEKALKAAVYLQPVSVAIEADQPSFQFYSSGVMTGDCGTNLDHGVLAVGYGQDRHVKYWKIKNSWGRDWGEDGFIRISRADSKGKPGKCGIAMQPSYPKAV